jgi:hypothetical protein
MNLVPDVALGEASWGADLVGLDSLRALHLAVASGDADRVDLGLLLDAALAVVCAEGEAQGEGWKGRTVDQDQDEG